MNHVEEQRNELEALSEIYYNEIKVISNEPPISFSIKVRPQASNIDELAIVGSNSDDEDVDSDENEVELGDEESDEESAPQQIQGPCVELLFELPSKYPDEKPSIQILDSHNIEDHELTGLLDNLNEKAEDSLGTVMVFMLVSDVVEWLITLSDREAEELEQEKEKKQQEAEANDKKRFDGTPVTVQTFLAWKAKFDAEILKNKLEQQRQQQADQASSGRLTGREMFETDKTLAESDLNFVEDLDQNQIEALLHNIEELDIQDDEGDDFEIELTDDDDDEDDDDLDDDYDDSDEEEEEKEKEEKKSSKVPQKSSASKK